jgi:hypothetical protein
MSKFEIIFAILHTADLTAEKIKAKDPNMSGEDAQNLEKVFAIMDGQHAVMCPAIDGSDEYYGYCGVADPKAAKEICWLMEQDSMLGCFTDREDFDKIYDSGEYDTGAGFCIEKECAEIISQEEWKAHVEAEQSKEGAT